MGHVILMKVHASIMSDHSELKKKEAIFTLCNLENIFQYISRIFHDGTNKEKHTKRKKDASGESETLIISHHIHISN